MADGFKPQFFPQLDGIMELLSRRATTASAWLHIACINFFVVGGCTSCIQLTHSLKAPVLVSALEPIK
jgi:hypothetical protein